MMSFKHSSFCTKFLILLNCSSNQGLNSLVNSSEIFFGEARETKNSMEISKRIRTLLLNGLVMTSFLNGPMANQNFLNLNYSCGNANVHDYEQVRKPKSWLQASHLSAASTLDLQHFATPSSRAIFTTFYRRRNENFIRDVGIKVLLLN